FLDDYIKVFKKDKDGLAGRFKIVGQVGLGIIIGLTMYYNSHVVITREVIEGKQLTYNKTEEVVSLPYTRVDNNGVNKTYVNVKATVTTVPFAKNHEFSYAKIASWFGEKSEGWVTPLLY